MVLSEKKRKVKVLYLYYRDKISISHILVDEILVVQQVTMYHSIWVTLFVPGRIEKETDYKIFPPPTPTNDVRCREGIAELATKRGDKIPHTTIGVLSPYWRSIQKPWNIL
jgi:hypothetical protein